MLLNILNINPEIDFPGFAPGSNQLSKAGREKRILSVVEQAKKFNLQVRFWEGVVSEKLRCTNISRGHKRIIQDAKTNGLPCCCIAEDDFLMSSDGAWEYYLQNIPDQYDIYFSGVYSGQIEGGRILNGFSGMTLYTVHHSFYDFFLSAKETDHIDRWLGNFAFEKNYRVCEPFTCLQMEGYSDNHGRLTQHASYLAEMKLFGRD